MNMVSLTGKVLNCYYKADTDAFITKLAVPHEHKIGKHKMTVESVFNIVMVDSDKIKTVDIAQGDTVLVEGHLNLDIKTNLSGNQNKKVMIYADNIEVTKRKPGIYDSTRERLGL